MGTWPTPAMKDGQVVVGAVIKKSIKDEVNIVYIVDIVITA